MTARHLTAVQNLLARFLLSDRLRTPQIVVSARSARRPFSELSAGSDPREMLIALSPALHLSLRVSDREWLSLQHPPATGTKGGQLLLV